ncbi:hypothetical protein K501DRAFT_78997 [Backusella circina FSU 941]|nr:hypothetical protein K501DRAFT_78997 [Backusella circina FSU 941]
MKKSRKIKQLQELEKTIKQYEAHMVKLNKQISQLDDKIQEKSNILDDLGHIFLAEEEEQHVALENVTNMLESEIEETKRNIREYGKVAKVIKVGSHRTHLKV